MSTIYDLDLSRLDGSSVSMRAFVGEVLLVVNTASKCGFTPQYEGLEALQKRYAPRGFSVLGFPCNQFAGQEPGDAQEIAQFCALSYDVSFPMFAKVDVNGPAAHPLFQRLKAARPGLLGSRAIKWNFTKFLISRSGEVTARFGPTVKPDALSAPIETLLATPA